MICLWCIQTMEGLLDTCYQLLLNLKEGSSMTLFYLFNLIIATNPPCIPRTLTYPEPIIFPIKQIPLTMLRIFRHNQTILWSTLLNSSCTARHDIPPISPRNSGSWSHLEVCNCGDQDWNKWESSSHKYSLSDSPYNPHQSFCLNLHPYK